MREMSATFFVLRRRSHGEKQSAIIDPQCNLSRVFPVSMSRIVVILILRGVAVPA